MSQLDPKVQELATMLLEAIEGWPASARKLDLNPIPSLEEVKHEESMSRRGTRRSLSGDAYWIDSDDKSWTAETFADRHLVAVVNYVTGKYGVVTAEYHWLVRELVKRGLVHKFNGRTNGTNVALITRFNAEAKEAAAAALLNGGEVPLSSLVATKGDARTFRPRGGIESFKVLKHYNSIHIKVRDCMANLKITNTSLGPATEESLHSLSMSDLAKITSALEVEVPPGAGHRVVLDAVLAQLSKMASRHQEFTIVLSDEASAAVEPTAAAVDTKEEVMSRSDTAINYDNLTREELAELLGRQSKELAATQVEMKKLRTLSEVVTDAGKTAGAAIARGGAIATIGTANVLARDQVLGLFGEEIPEWAASEWFQNGSLVVPPAIMLAIVDIGPAVGLPVPELGREHVRSAAIMGLEHAGIKNTEAAAKKAWEVIAPMFAMYRMAGEQAAKAKELEDIPDYTGKVEEAREVKQTADLREVNN